MTPGAAPRRAVGPVYGPGLTLLWLLSLGVFFQFSDLTVRWPGLMIWTMVFLPGFVLTAACVYRGEIRQRRDDVWVPVATWAALAALGFLAAHVFPVTHLAHALIPTELFVSLLDIVVALWIAARAISLLWEGLVRTLVLLSMPVLLLGYTWFFVVQMPARSYSGPLPPLSSQERALRDDLERHVRALALEIGERSEVTWAAKERAAEYIEREFIGLGYAVRSQRYTADGRSFRNLEVTIPGRSRPDEIVLVGGHYDTVADAAGANDNASGTAAVLALARVLAGARPARTIRLVAFTNEEPPHFETESMGSRVYAAEASRRGERIVAISLETIGYYSSQPGSQRYLFPFSLFYPNRGDFIGFVGDVRSRALVHRSIAAFRRTTSFPSQGIAAPAWIPGIHWSDHASFWIHGYRAIMITDTAVFRYPYYHTPEDTADKVDYERMGRVVWGVAQVIRELAG